MKRLIMMLALIVALAVILTGCAGKSPAAESVPEADCAKEPGSIESEEIEESGAHTEHYELYDEYGVLCGYGICEYNELDQVVLEEQFDNDGNSMTRWERNYSEDGSQCETVVYSWNEFDMKMIEFFGENGNSLEQHSYDNRDALISISRYHENGCLMSMEMYAGEPGAEWLASEASFDENGLPVAEQMYNPDGSKGMSTFREHDELGREIKSVYYGEDGSLMWNRRHTYDDRNFCIRTDEYDEQDVLVGYELKEYTPEGFINCLEEYSADGAMQRRTVTEYRADGQMASEHIYDGAGNLYQYMLREFDESGRIIKAEDFTGSGELTLSRKYLYSKDGSFIVIATHPDGTTAYSDRYDINGDFIGRIE